MELLVVTEKHGTRFFIPDDNDTFLIPFMLIISERLDDGNWYEDQFKDQAEDLIQQFNELYGEVLQLNRPIEDWLKDEERLLATVTKFLEKRRRYEYEEWEIISTEN